MGLLWPRRRLTVRWPAQIKGDSLLKLGLTVGTKLGHQKVRQCDGPAAMHAQSLNTPGRFVPDQHPFTEAREARHGASGRVGPTRLFWTGKATCVDERPAVGRALIRRNSFDGQSFRLVASRSFPMNDLDLQQHVLDELCFDPKVDPAHIGVIAEKGVITLTGHVTSYAEKAAAERATRRVKGVRAIAEKIEVRLPNHKRIADDEIAQRVADVLALNATIPADAIQIRVQDGWVSLEGQVEWQFQRAEAQSQISKLSGLTGIINNITLKHYPPSPDTQWQIENALRRNRLLAGTSIMVTLLENNHVILDGEVHGLDQLRAAEKIAWSVPGVRLVDNRLEVL